MSDRFGAAYTVLPPCFPQSLPEYHCTGTHSESCGLSEKDYPSSAPLAPSFQIQDDADARLWPWAGLYNPEILFLFAAGHPTGFSRQLRRRILSQPQGILEPLNLFPTPGECFEPRPNLSLGGHDYRPVPRRSLFEGFGGFRLPFRVLIK